MTEAQKLSAVGKSRILIALKRFGSVRKVSRLLGVSHTSLFRWMKENKLRMPQVSEEVLEEMQLARKMKRKVHAGLAVWAKNHEGAILPRSTKAIARETGLTEDQVKTYLYRRRKETKVLMRKILNMIKTVDSVVVETTTKELVDLKKVSTLKFIYDHWALKSALKFVYEGREMIADIESLHSFLSVMLQQTNQKRDAFIEKLEVAAERL